MLDELSEELGLFESEVTELKWVSSISIVEDETRWLIHVFLIITEVEDFHLNWENDGFCWIKPGEYMRDSVSWLTTVLAEVEGLKGDG